MSTYINSNDEQVKLELELRLIAINNTLNTINDVKKFIGTTTKITITSYLISNGYHINQLLDLEDIKLALENKRTIIKNQLDIYLIK
jgi:hypothetical protein